MEQKRFKKRFFSSIAEIAWLNERGQEGYRLVMRKDSRYVFELVAGKRWYYHVEWLDAAPESESVRAYVASYEEGVQLATTCSLWGYFISESPITPKTEGRLRTATHYRNTALLIYAANIITAILIGYQLSIRGYLETNKIFLEAPTFKKAANVVLTLCRRILYGGKVILYRYSKLLSGIFGKTEATAVLGILIPLAIVLAVTAAFWSAEWIKNRVPYPNEKLSSEDGEEETEDAYAEQEASGKPEEDC